MIYLDTAAVVKLVRPETFTADLIDWLNERPTLTRVSSTLVEIEVSRALRRAAPESLGRVPVVLSRLYRLEIDASVRAVASAYDDPNLRSLDAIHLATAAILADRSNDALHAFVTYDKRLLSAAETAGLPVASPGAD